MVRWCFGAFAILASASAHAAPATWAEVEPIPGADALVVSGDSTHVIAKINGLWFVSTEPLGIYENTPTIHRAFDASVLAKQPAIAFVVESRDGGSEMGSAIDQLVILCAANAQLRPCGAIEIGHLEWVLDAEHRREYPGAAFSLRKRPHVEVELEPKLVAPDMLRLTLKRNSTLAPPEGAWDHETLATMDALRKSVGLYRIVDDELVRVN
jgi:hypothetical protein